LVVFLRTILFTNHTQKITFSAGESYIMSDEREKNAVFRQANSADAGNDPRIPRTTAATQMKSDFGIDIPSEVVPLPSSGKTYPVGSSFHGCDSVDIKAMTAREEDILTSSALLKKGTVLSELIKSCLMDKTINPNELLSGDRNALMVAIRVTGYGPDYDADIQCPECEVKSAHSFNLGTLPIKRLEIDPVTPGTNLFEFKLPRTGKTVKFKFMTGRDEEDIMSMQQKQKKLGMTIDSAISTTLLYSIVSIDGIDDRAKIAAFSKAIPAQDSLALRNYIRENEPGITMRQESECTACGHIEEVDMPLGPTFLWPSARR